MSEIVHLPPACSSPNMATHATGHTHPRGPHPFWICSPNSIPQAAESVHVLSRQQHYQYIRELMQQCQSPPYMHTLPPSPPAAMSLLPPLPTSHLPHTLSPTSVSSGQLTIKLKWKIQNLTTAQNNNNTESQVLTEVINCVMCYNNICCV